MNLEYKPFMLEFMHPFGVSSNTRKETPTVFIKISSEGFSGYGEACLPAYLGETTEETIKFFEKARTLLSASSLASDMADIIQRTDLLAPGNNAAKAAIDIAIHDLFGKSTSQSVAILYGFEKSPNKATSFTIGIDKEEILIQKIKEAQDFSILKIKAGTKDDKSLINFIRQHTDKPLYVDVNQGWTDKNYVLDMIFWMKEQGVVLVEQPMPVALRDEMAWVTSRSPIPTIADESVKRLTDLKNLKDVFSGFNIKLMKCTGVAEALKMIHFCKEHQRVILLGCMAESSCATSAMAQLMGFADYIDLDAPLLYKNDPFSGVTYHHGMLELNDLPGIGANPREGFFI